MKISVIVNSYTGTEPYLEECLESIMAQTVAPFEVIVVLDGYTKPTVYPGTTTIIRDKNMGIAYSREEGVNLSRGTHILFIDADDVIPENYIEEMMSTMRWKKVDIVYPSCILWSRWGPDKKKENAYYTPSIRVSMKEMLVHNQIVVSSLMKKKVYTDVGGFDPDLVMFEDWKFFLRAMQKGYKVYRANCFLKYRQRVLSRNHTHDEDRERITEKIRSDILKLTI